LDAFQITDAFSASFFGLIGIWAAVVRRHWFLRFAVVCLFLLLALLIPAYEIVIEFGIQIGLVLAGVWLVRGRKNWRPRVSLETILLLMVVVVISAVAAKVPEFGLFKWLDLIGTGVGIAGFSLICLWIVFGKARWWKRILIGLLGIGLFLAMVFSGEMLLYTMRGGLWMHYGNLGYIKLWLLRTGPSIALGVILLCSVLGLARASGWFAEAQSDSKSRLSRSVVASRITLVTIVLLVATPLFYIFYRLLTPTPYPVVEMPQPNAFDDYVAAGMMITTDDINALIKNMDSMPTLKLEREIDQLSGVFDRIDLGSSRAEGRIRHYGEDQQAEAMRASEATRYTPHGIYPTDWKCGRPSKRSIGLYAVWKRF